MCVLCLGELSGRAQRAEKTCAHDTSQPHYTMEERERACTPAALTMIPLPLPRSLTPSPSSGSHQDSDDLMMRETTLIIHTQQTSPLAVLLSRTDTHRDIYRHERNDRWTQTPMHSRKYTNKDKYRDTGLVQYARIQ